MYPLKYEGKQKLHVSTMCSSM